MTLFDNMPHDKYLAEEAVSASALKSLRKSPAHCYGQFLDPARPAQKTTTAMSAGSLLHMVALQPELVDSHYIVRPECMDMRTKAGKDWAASVVDGITIITADQLATAQAQTRNIRALPEVADIMSSGSAEVSAFWTRDYVACKCRFDWLARTASGAARILEVKTCQDASPNGFAKAIGRYCYDIAAAWYMDGARRVTGRAVDQYIIAAVESDWPHVAQCYEIDPLFLEAAEQEVDELFAQYVECRRTNFWPGYSTGAQTIGVTRFERRNEQIEVEYV